jgi:SAM-dependent methyltransferase
MSSTTRPSADDIRTAVAARYSAVGRDPAAETVIPVGREWAERLGYPASLLDAVPAIAVSAFTGIGAPAFVAGLTAGERVLDLGCGGGLDTVIMARQVAPEGQVHGIDLAPAMLATARQAVAQAGLKNVTLREAAAESLPLPDSSIDVAVVNGLFNLVPDKAAVAAELTRVLRPNSRLVGAEIVITDAREPQAFDAESWFR